MSTNQQLPQTASPAATPPPEPAITPEAIIEQLRALSAHIPEVTPLASEQRAVLRRRGRTSRNVELLRSSISMIGSADLVTQAVGHDAGEVREMFDERTRWGAVEDELRAMLNGIVGANLVRNQRLAFIADRAYGVGSQLARDPEHAGLVPHVQEIKRLKKLERRRKPAVTAPKTPPPAVGALPETKA